MCSSTRRLSPCCSQQQQQLFSQILFGYRTTTPIDLALTALFAACVIRWMVLLSPKGEEIRVTQARLSPEQEEQIFVTPKVSQIKGYSSVNSVI